MYAKCAECGAYVHYVRRSLERHASEHAKSLFHGSAVWFATADVVPKWVRVPIVGGDVRVLPGAGS